MDFISDLEYGRRKLMDDYKEQIECQDCGYMTNAYEAFIVGLDEYYCPDCCPEEYGE
jgi:Zn finger protein HypA/HybF involved in hydrogenase expression